jgi:sortase (surface protein transpeptidase)
VHSSELGGRWPFRARSAGTSRAGWLFALSGSVLVTIPLWWPSGRSEVSVGTPPWSRPSPAATHLAAPPVAALPAEAESVGVHSARPADLEPIIAARRPLRLSIPRLGVAAPIVPVGTRPTGAMEVPEDIGTVGWYRFGPSPGLPGSSVLVGHVDSRGGGPGVFFGLSRLGPGDRVRVQIAGGTWTAFLVVSRTQVPKDQLPAAAFTREGNSVLTLITCGGAFDDRAGHYTDNVVVGAVPLRSS